MRRAVGASTADAVGSPVVTAWDEEAVHRGLIADVSAMSPYPCLPRSHPPARVPRRRDPVGPRYARVPSGSETCDFCLMLASRGFACRPGATAFMGHVHARCDCLMVPGWPGMTVAGYDPAALYRRWTDSVDLRASERAERNGTSEAEERAKIMAAYVRRASAAKARAKAGATRAERPAAASGEADYGERARTGAERAGRAGYAIPESKLARYTLDKSSPRDRDKAAAFELALGFTADDAGEVMRQVYEHARDHSPKKSGLSDYGDLYTVDRIMRGSNGKTANVRTGWIKRPGENKM